MISVKIYFLHIKNGQEMETQHSLEPTDVIMLEILAVETFSSQSLLVTAHQKYRIWSDVTQRWYDGYVLSSSPNGFFNIMASIIGKRVKNTPCFCLCGAYDRNDNTGFAIGSNKEFEVPENVSELYFFPNDSKGFYWNNRGSIKIGIERLK